MWDKRANAILFVSNTKVGAEKALLMTQQRMSVDQIKESFVHDTVNTIKITEKKFSKGDNDIIDKIEWIEGTSPIIHEPEKDFSFAIIRSIVDPEPKSLSEARGIITADYQNFLEQEWLKQLRKKYTVNVNQDVLSQIK